MPLPGVIETNSAFEFALSVAPNIVYARYKQYGQVRSSDHFGMVIDLMLPFPAWSARVVFRVWRADREPERTGFRRKYVRDNAYAGLEDL